MNAQALYDPMNEHDACGVGLVANINNVASHQIVLQGITVLKRLMHRGAAGGDPETGDGAGLLLSMPHKFFRKRIGVFDHLAIRNSPIFSINLREYEIFIVPILICVV